MGNHILRDGIHLSPEGNNLFPSLTSNKQKQIRTAIFSAVTVKLRGLIRGLFDPCSLRLGKT